MVRFDETFAYFSICFFEIKIASLTGITVYHFSDFGCAAMPFDFVMSNVAFLLFDGLKLAPNIIIGNRVYCGFDIVCTSILKKCVVCLKHHFQVMLKHAIRW